MMHRWGDGWFRKYGDEFDEAIRVLEKRIREWAHCGICGKEKWGCYQDDFLTLWDGGLRYIFTPYKGYVIGDTKLAKFLHRLDTHIIPGKKTMLGRLWYGLANLNEKLGLVKLVHKWQAKRINKAFQVTCKEYPHFIDELVSDVCCYEMIKPCKWGDVDGTKIHSKYWKTIDKFEDFVL